MRVTTTSNYNTMRDSLGSALSRVSELQASMGTGRRINKPSDDPVGSAKALRFRSYEADQVAYARSADDATTRLGVADTKLQHVSASLRQVRQLAIQANNTVLSSEARGALRDQLLALRDEVLGLANSSHGGHALFGGHAETAVAQQPDGTWAYAGDAGQVRRRVGQGTVVTVNADGPKAFGFDQPPGQDLFSVLDRLAASVVSGDPYALAQGQRELEARADQVLGALGTVGATTNAVDAARSRGEQFVAQITAERSEIEDLDLAEAVLQLSDARTAYEAALGAVAKADVPSLADFLR
ncbi:MAG: flagellar hook-associated protein FlgL [Actinomycetota bacterium]|nr:flagellar hook-associated protein FlgL [Actinomycetota bacterium]